MLVLALSAALAAQEKKTPDPKEVEPPEEDTALATKEYSFNPLQAEKEIKIGNYYFKKSNYRAAANRFREAGKWNPGSAEAQLRLAESLEKMKDQKGAMEAYEKYLELAPDAKNATAIKKKIATAK